MVKTKLFSRMYPSLDSVAIDVDKYITKLVQNGLTILGINYIPIYKNDMNYFNAVVTYIEGKRF